MTTKPGRVTHKSRGLARLNGKLNMLYLYYHQAYGHQTCQGGGLVMDFHR